MNAKKMVVQVMKKNHVGIDISKEKCQRQENIKCFQQMNNTQEVLNVKVRLFFLLGNHLNKTKGNKSYIFIGQWAVNPSPTNLIATRGYSYSGPGSTGRTLQK